MIAPSSISPHPATPARRVARALLGGCAFAALLGLIHFSARNVPPASEVATTDAGWETVVSNDDLWHGLLIGALYASCCLLPRRKPGT